MVCVAVAAAAPQLAWGAWPGVGVVAPRVSCSFSASCSYEFPFVTAVVEIVKHEDEFYNK